MTTWHVTNFLSFLKNSKFKIQKLKKKSQKNQRIDMWNPFNDVTVPLTEGTKLRWKKIEGPHWDFAMKMETKGMIKPKKKKKISDIW